MPLDRSSTSGGGGCSPQPRCRRQVGGLKAVAEITGLARSTINRGEDDLDAEPPAKGQVRRAGGGRRPVAENDPGLVPELKRLVEPATLGDPMRPLIWVSKSMDKLAAALTVMGHPVSADTVARELVKLGFSRQHNRKADEGSKHPDRVVLKARLRHDAQFEHINAKVVAAQAAGQPVISVDTKTKELVGNDKNGGSHDAQRVNRCASRYTTSSTRSWARSRLTASTT